MKLPSLQSHAGVTTNTKYWSFTTCTLKMLISSFVGCSDISVTSLPSETKGFFCFGINKPLEKSVFSHTYNLKKEANFKEKKHAEHCLTHLNKTTCEIWSIVDKVHFWVKYLMPFLHRNLQFLCSELTHSKQTTLHTFGKCHSHYLNSSITHFSTLCLSKIINEKRNVINLV